MNALVAYGSDDSESEHEHEEQQQQQISNQIQAEGKITQIEEDQSAIISDQQQQEQQFNLVEPRPPRRQSDLYEDDDSGGHYSRDRYGENDSDNEEGNETEEELLRTGQNLSSFLMADNQTTGASTPAGGAGYTPRGVNGLEDGELMQEEEQQMEMDQEEGISTKAVPPSPPGQCSPTLQRKFEHFFERKSAGWDPNSMIKSRRDFKNPSCYETLVNMFGIDEKGTNFPAEVFDPNAFRPEDFYDALGDHQAAMEAKRKKQQQSSLDTSRKSRFEGK